MWYFTWILGIGVALGFGIINVMWLEASGKFARDPLPAGLHGKPGDPGKPDAHDAARVAGKDTPS